MINFGANILHSPIRGGKRHNLTSTIIKRTNLTEKGSMLVNISPHLIHRRVDAETACVNTVISKLEDDNISTAVRILCSDDNPADYSDEVFRKLQDEHPPNHNMFAPNKKQTHLQHFKFQRRM